jgi:hypothetical protein
MTHVARVTWAQVHASALDLVLMLKKSSLPARRAAWAVAFDREFDRLEIKK